MLSRIRCFGVLALSLAALTTLPACRSSASLERVVASAQKQQTELLRQAGEQLGIPIRTETTVALNQPGGRLVLASAQGFESQPATRLPEGVNMGVAFVGSPNSEIPEGVYSLRVFANPQGPGETPGRIQLRDASGRMVREVPATVNVETMTLPEDAARRITNIVFRPSRIAGTCNPAYETCYCCPNGYIVCTGAFVQSLIANPN